MVFGRIIVVRRICRPIAACAVVLAFLASVGLTACRLPDVHNTRILKAELPPSTWDSINAAFSFDSNQTEAMRNQAAQVFASVADYKVDWWVFAYPGTVQQAASALVNPSGSVVALPRTDNLGEALETHLAWWEEEQRQSKGQAWLDQAHARAAAWKSRTQDVAEVTYVQEEYFGSNEEILRSVSWSFVLVSPLIDLEPLETRAGTSLVIARYDWLYNLLETGEESSE